MRYELNGIGKHLIMRQSKELKKYVWVWFPMLLGAYLAIRFGLDNQVHMYIFIVMLFVFFNIYIPINLKGKFKKIILNIEFFDTTLKIETKTGVKYLNTIEVNKTTGSFTGFGKNHTNGYIIKNIDDAKEYWLIESFFNEIEEIKVELKKYI